MARWVAATGAVLAYLDFAAAHPTFLPEAYTSGTFGAASAKRGKLDGSATLPLSSSLSSSPQPPPLPATVSLGLPDKLAGGLEVLATATALAALDVALTLSPHDEALREQQAALLDELSFGPADPPKVLVSFWNLCGGEVGLHWLNKNAPDDGTHTSPALTQVRLIEPSEEVDMLTYAGHVFVVVGDGGTGDRLVRFTVAEGVDRYVAIHCGGEGDGEGGGESAGAGSSGGRGGGDNDDEGFDDEGNW